MARVSKDAAALPLFPLHVLQKMQHFGGELVGVLDEREMADRRLQQQAGAGNARGHELGVLALDGLVMVGVGESFSYSFSARAMNA